MDLVREVTYNRFKQAVEKIPQFKAGDTIGVYVKVKEGEKERIQLFKGVVLKVQGSGMGKTFTVRKMSSGIGVERTFPFVSPAIDRVELIAIGKVRRSKLFYLRELRGRAARLTSELVYSGPSSSKKKAAEKNEAADTEDATLEAAQQQKAPANESAESKAEGQSKEKNTKKSE